MADNTNGSEKHVFVTGGAGFIGSHTALVLLDHGYRVTAVDNYSNSRPKVLEHIQRLAGEEKSKRLTLLEMDVRDKEGLDKLFAANKFCGVIHFAGFKAVGESVEIPLEYYDNNFVASVVLLEVMRKHECFNLVFSSSCTVYGLPDKLPLDESAVLNAISPYGRTKLFQEDMFRDVAVSDKRWRILLLRYFNPIGAHPSGELGEHPVGIPNNLMPYIQQVALGQREFLRVFGNDYPTPDGSPVRDYIHVVDLAEGHVAAVKKLVDTPDYGCQAINLGTGTGTSVLEMIRVWEEETGSKVAYQIMPRRAGDSTAVWADTTKAAAELGWKSKLDVRDMCRDQWAWATKYPNGFEY